MTGDDDLTDRAKRDAVGDKVDLAEVDVVGSGISETTRMSLNVLHDLGRLQRMPPAWTENRDMIMRLFTPFFERSAQCPGRDRPQCCQAGDGQACFPNWREREDPEWYAQEINKMLGQVNGRIGQEGPLAPALAADEAFELGSLFTEALIKFRWDGHAKRGATVAAGAKLGGDMRRATNPTRRDAADTITAVNALLKTGMGPTDAYRRVARQQGVSEQTIGKEYRAAKKSR